MGSQTGKLIPEIKKDGFQIVSADYFKHGLRMGEPTCTLQRSCIVFNKMAITELNSCERIRIEYNLQRRWILVVPVTAKDKDGIIWLKGGKEPAAKKLMCEKFAEQLYAEWKWERGRVYRATGQIVKMDQKVMMLFDFSNTEHWVAREKTAGEPNG